MAEHNDDAWLAWYTAAFSRSKRLTPRMLKEAMAGQEPRKKGRQSPEEQIAVLKSMFSRRRQG